MANIGFLTHWRQEIISHPEYQAMVARTKRLADKVPHGELAYRLAKRVKSGIEGFALPTTMWTEMGFHYIGPVDGHDVKGIEKALNQARQEKRKPPLIHVITHFASR